VLIPMMMLLSILFPKNPVSQEPEISMVGWTADLTVAFGFA
jgi:hypothetical protein